MGGRVQIKDNRRGAATTDSFAATPTGNVQLHKLQGRPTAQKHAVWGNWKLGLGRWKIFHSGLILRQLTFTTRCPQ